MTKRTKKYAMAAALTLVGVGLAAQSASAACNPPKFASTYNPATAAYVYWTTSITELGSELVGKLWSNGTDYSGSCNDGSQTFLYYGTRTGTFGLSVSLGNACVPPGLCPSGNLNFRAWVTSPDGSSQETSARQVPETPAGGVNFDFSDVSVHLAAAPRPRFQSKGKVGTNLNISTFPEPIPGDAASLATVTGCNLRMAASAIWPGSLATAYPTTLTTVGVSGGACATANAAVDCSTSVEKWLVYQVVTNAGPDPIVGTATRVNCNPALADPKNRIAPKKNVVGVRN